MESAANSRLRSEEETGGRVIVVAISEVTSTVIGFFLSFRKNSIAVRDLTVKKNLSNLGLFRKPRIDA
jgi:hypothetical protein